MSGIFVSEREISTRVGVHLTDVAGLDTGWSMPVALWHAPGGFDTRERPDNRTCVTIALRLSGSLVQHVGPRRPERLRPNGFSVHPAGNDLRFVAPAEIRFAHLYVSDRFLRQVSTQISAFEQHEAGLLRDDRVMYEDGELSRQLEAYVRRAFDRTEAPSQLEMESRANLIAIHLLRHHGTGSVENRSGGTTLAAWQVKRVCSFIDEHLAEPVTLADLAGLIGVSAQHFCRAFHRSMDMSPGRWMQRKRMEHACELLADPARTLTDVAQSLGYGGQSAFGAAFRQVMGVTPSQYRRSVGGAPVAPTLSGSTTHG